MSRDICKCKNDSPRPSKRRYLTINGKTHCISEWARIVGVSPGTIRSRLRNGDSPEIAIRRTYDHCESIGKANSKRRRLSPKAYGMIKGTAIGNDRKQIAELSSLSLSMQCNVSRYIHDNPASTVREAVDAIMLGAPIDTWGRAYDAMMKLKYNDRVRMCRQLLADIQKSPQDCDTARPGCSLSLTPGETGGVA